MTAENPQTDQDDTKTTVFSHDQAFVQEVVYVYSQSVPVFLGNIFNAVLVYAVFQDHAYFASGIAWLIASLLSATLRFIYAKKFNATVASTTNIQPWYRRYYVTTLISAAVWGSAGIIFFSEGNAAYQLLLAFIVSSMSAGAVSILPVFIGLYYRYLAVTLIPIDIMLLTRGEDVGFLTGLLLVMFGLIMSQAAKTMNNLITRAIELRFKLEKLATIDPLTGLYNRRFFNETLAREWERARRDQKELALIMIDVDHFKACNDHYGHLRGDDILKSLAEIIEHTMLRGIDLTCRYGGEEFAILLPNTSAENARNMAEKLRHNVASKRIVHEYSETAPYLTISAGVSAMIPEEQSKAEWLINQADQALYKAKHSGRNRVQSWDS